MYKEDRTEPFWWGMFSMGGVVAALLIPVHIFLIGLAVPLGLIDKSLLEYSRMKTLLANPLVKVYLFVLIVPPLFHAAHRIRFSLHEMGIRKLLLSLDVLCYGGALLGTAVSLYVLWVI
ncbi:MAG: fumarate reductase subunit D [Gemmatimonadetes bacterium]|nr:fumarate reductase subunit D [Gemmatimonadota bacterium]